MLGAARERSAGMSVLYALPRLAFPLLLSGRWSDVVSVAEEARSLSDSAGQASLSAAPLALLALIAALRGEDRFEVLLTDLDAVVERHPIGILAGPTSDVRRWAVGVRAALAGEAATAHHQLSQMAIPALTRMASLDRIDAAVRAGDLPQATTWVEELAVFASATRWPWAIGVVDLGRALVSAPAAAPRYFEDALAHLGRAHRPYDVARAHLAYGELLRRSQQRVDARPHLRQALEIFEDLRAEPFVTRAAHELRASGETARKRDVTTQVRLTPMERQVAHLVSRGMSNKEVAAVCWVSPRTVAYHLRNCFAKTGVTSRGELARLDLS
jgi:DNA-binding CsgD family transcriptional regulator